MTAEQANASASVAVTDELLDQAKELERLVQRLLVAEQSAFTQEASQFGLTGPQFVTLTAIDQFDGGQERMGKIAGMAHQCSATMTGIIDRLENMGLVERHNNPNDRRSVLVSMTEKGKSRLEQVRAVRRNRVANVLAAIDPQLRVRVYEVLLQYADALESLGEQGTAE